MKVSSLATDGIEVSEVYDKESDVYYFTVRTGEPSIVVEHDDQLLIEIGMFTRFPTGFRILNYSKHKKRVPSYRDYFKKICNQLGLRKLKDDLEIRQRRFDRFFEKAVG